jgi:two-component system chemotaxis response regulator CheY
VSKDFQKKSIEELKAQAEKGSAEAQAALGMLYELGLEVKPDPNEAAKFWGMAAKNGDPLAQYSLAQIISKNFEDSEENRAISQALFKKAEEHGLVREDKVLRFLEKDKGNAAKVMIIDDSITVRTSLKRYLESDGCEVIEAEDGQQALNLLKKTPDIKLVFTDLNMPVMDGLQFVKILRAIPEFKNLPVVVITTESSGDIVLKGKQLGIQGWIVKPAKPHFLRMHLLKFT